MSKRTREVVAGVRAGSTLKSGKAWAYEKRQLVRLQRRRRQGGRVSAFVSAGAEASTLEMLLVWSVVVMVCVAIWLAAADLVGLILLALQRAVS